MKRENLWDVGKPIVSAIIGAVVATAGTVWAARGEFDSYDRRISVLEAHQQADEQHFIDAMNEIRTDLRELRSALIEQGRSR